MDYRLKQGCITDIEAYYLEFPPHFMQQRLSILHLEALNAMVALNVWALLKGHQAASIPLLGWLYSSFHLPSREREGLFSIKHARERFDL